MAADKAKKGFAGLHAMVSEVEVAKAPTEPPISRSEPITAEKSPPAPAKSRYWMWWVVGGAAVLLFAALQAPPRWNPPSSAPPKPSYQPDYRPLPPPPPRPQVDDYSEMKPPVGTDLIASRANIRYCLFQKERLNQAKRLIYGYQQAVTDLLNGEIDDWNSRCARYRYRASDYTAAQAEVAAKLPNLQAEAAVLVTVWARNATPSWPPSEPTIPDRPLIHPPVPPPPSPSPITSAPEPPKHAPRLDSQPVTGDEVFERAFGGIWAQDREGCPGSGKRSLFPPVTITADRAVTRTAKCEFEEKQGSDSEWRVKMACSSHLKNWTSDVRLIREGDILKWTNDKGTTTYWRC